MTLHERAEYILQLVDGLEAQVARIAAVEIALRDVVEECARVAECELIPKTTGEGGGLVDDPIGLQENIAAAIRRLAKE